jgi:hypothetical protein
VSAALYSLWVGDGERDLVDISNPSNSQSAAVSDACTSSLVAYRARMALPTMCVSVANTERALFSAEYDEYVQCARTAQDCRGCVSKLFKTSRDVDEPGFSVFVDFLKKIESTVSSRFISKWLIRWWRWTHWSVVPVTCIVPLSGGGPLAAAAAAAAVVVVVVEEL